MSRNLGLTLALMGARSDRKHDGMPYASNIRVVEGDAVSVKSQATRAEPISGPLAGQTWVRLLRRCRSVPIKKMCDAQCCRSAGGGGCIRNAISSSSPALAHEEVARGRSRNTAVTVSAGSCLGRWVASTTSNAFKWQGSIGRDGLARSVMRRQMEGVRGKGWREGQNDKSAAQIPAMLSLSGRSGEQALGG